MSFEWQRALFNSLKQLSLRPRCTLCERFAVGVFCPDCQHQLKTCQLSSPLTTIDGFPLLAWGQYQGMLRQALARLKYDQKPKIAQFLGQQLGIAWLETQLNVHHSTVLPIPLHQKREQERGYNQAALIAEGFCHVTGFNLTLNGLVRVRATAAQFKLSPHDRLANVAQAFQLGSYFTKETYGKSVLLLDDIYTTGATIHSAVDTLSQAGLKVSGVAVVAKA